MDLWLQIILIAVFLAIATAICATYQRVESWWHFRTWDKLKSNFNWRLFVVLFGFPIVAGVAIIIHNW